MKFINWKENKKLRNISQDSTDRYFGKHKFGLKKIVQRRKDEETKYIYQNVKRTIIDVLIWIREKGLFNSMEWIPVKMAYTYNHHGRNRWIRFDYISSLIFKVYLRTCIEEMIDDGGIIYLPNGYMIYVQEYIPNEYELRTKNIFYRNQYGDYFRVVLAGKSEKNVNLVILSSKLFKKLYENLKSGKRYIQPL